jgi:tRNA threonylcarbamoyladenosine biosynthesis protein TsaE
MVKIGPKISKNTKDTKKIAKDFLGKILKKKHTKASVVGLYGNLGAGKTAFTKAIARHLLVKNKVSSPTFVIIKKYSIKSKQYDFLFHLDAYRLKNEKELKKLGWAEIVSNPKHLVFIEWPENVAGAMPKKHHKILISHTEQGHRIFKFKI